MTIEAAEPANEPTYKEVLSAIVYIEMHHFQGTRIVACCLTLRDGRVVLATASGSPNMPFDITAVAAAARSNADQQVAATLFAVPIDA